MKKLRLAIIGCGAVTEYIYLPLMKFYDHIINEIVLVDKFLPRASQLAESFGIAAVEDDYRKIFKKVNAAIVALPNYLHSPVTIDLLQQGIHVLVEKPMAIKTNECDAMIEAARNSSAYLAVGHMLRFSESYRLVKQVIERELLGDIKRFELYQGTIFSWPLKSNYLFRKEHAGGGILFDIGAHELDLLLWWLGDYESVEYFDDAMGGVEADCEIHFQMRSGASGKVELSRTRNLKNICIIYGEKGILEVESWGLNPLLKLKFNNSDIVLSGKYNQYKTPEEIKFDVWHRSFYDFVEAILTDREPFITGREGKKVIELIETCYSLRQPLAYPWMSFNIDEEGLLIKQ